MRRLNLSLYLFLMPLLPYIFVSGGCATTPTRLHIDGIQKTVKPLLTLGSVSEYRYSNGLTLLVYPDRNSPTIAYQTWYDVGSKDETPGYTGLAHLFEHMMFKKTKNLADGEFDRILDTAGAEGQNAFTTHDRTVYIQELPKERLELIIRLESDRMANLIIDEEAFKTEREVVQNERRLRTENSPDGMMFQEIFGLAYQTHPYRWPVIGYQEDLNRMTATDARAFYDRFYRPDRATIVVTGDINPDEVARLVKSYYESIQPRTSNTATSGKSSIEAELKGLKQKKIPFNIQIEKLLIGFRSPPGASEDRAALLVLDGILSGGKSSRFEKKLVETGIAAGAFSHWMEAEDPSLFLIGASLMENRISEEAESVILRELETLQKELVSDAEIKRVVKKIRFSLFEGLNSNAEIANFLGESQSLYGDFTKGLTLIDDLSRIQPIDVQRVSKKYFNLNSRVVLRGIPKTSKAGKSR